MVFENKTILVAPLDWGLGHASRCVPFIRELSRNNRVIVCTTILNDFFIRAYFPAIEQVEIPSYNISYSSRAPQWLSVARRLPALLRIIKSERVAAEKLVRRYNADVIISDNRYGMYETKTINIFICHQVNLVLPFFSKAINRLHRRFLRHFSEVWIPDYADKKRRLAGELSDNKLLTVKSRFIGPLSALGKDNRQYEPVYDVLFLLSGPEPQRTILEDLLFAQANLKNKKVAVVRGTNTQSHRKINADLLCDVCSGEELAKLIKTSRVVVCRSGYSTLMDLHLLGKNEMILVPTPGQPEQEYLATHWRKEFGAKVIAQKELSQNLAGIGGLLNADSAGG